MRDTKHCRRVGGYLLRIQKRKTGRADSGSSLQVITIICAVIAALASLGSAIITRQQLTRYVVRETVTFTPQETTDYFPLHLGNWWEYEGTAREEGPNNGNIERQVRIRMRVIRYFTVGAGRFYVMEGHPSQIIGAAESTGEGEGIIRVKPQRFGYLVVSNKVFQVEPDDLSDVLKEIPDDSDAPLDWLDNDDLVLESPLYKGLRFGSSCDLTRNPAAYCWYVNDCMGELVPKKEHYTELPEFQLVRVHLPDDIQVWFQPFVGILDYRYSHHGTRYELSVHLSHYHVHTGY